MRKQQIPFVSGLNELQTEQWLMHLQKVMPEYEVIQLQQDNLSEYGNSELAIVANPNINLVSSLPKLKWVQSLWAGVESLVTDLPFHIGICRMEDGALQTAMSEAVLAWTLYLHRDMYRYGQQQIKKIWRQHPWQPASDTKVAVLGLGQLGIAACAQLRNNQFTVLGWSRTEKRLAGVETYAGDQGLNRVLASADIVVLLLPLTPQTHGLFNNHTFSQMKPGASLINFARGGIIEDSALLSMLESGQLSHAVLDVFDREPLTKDHPFWEAENVTILPHISAPTNMATASVIVADNIRNWLNSGALPQMVNREIGY